MNPGNNQQLYEQAEPLSINEWKGPVLVIAPHPDDESLGCGGTIALLRKNGITVQVVFVSDGSMSHPNSIQYPAEKRVALRESEAVAALKLLDVKDDRIHFMRLKDAQVPAEHTTGFEEAVNRFSALVTAIKPATVLVPWRRDPHPDHRASWQIVNAALQKSKMRVRLLEYLIWLWERGASDEFPDAASVRLWKVNIEEMMNVKQSAVMAHQSQVSRLIGDDPEGFILSPEVLSHFKRAWEIFVEINECNHA